MNIGLVIGSKLTRSMVTTDNTEGRVRSQDNAGWTPATAKHTICSNYSGEIIWTSTSFFLYGGDPRSALGIQDQNYMLW